MRVVIQRAQWGKVWVGDSCVGKIDGGLVLLVGIAPDDSSDVVDAMAKKIVNLRLFDDADGRPNHSLLDVGGEALVVSQFTLFADCKKGRRPFYGNAGAPELAEKLCEHFVGSLHDLGIATATGEFGAMMRVELCNDGPITIVLDSEDLKR